LKSPLTKIADTTFQWQVDIIDQPAPGDYIVDGSSLSFRVFEGGAWGSWIDVDPLDNAQKISFSGEATGERGTNRTYVQFRASDVLGNGDTKEFPIRINVAPQIKIPDGMDGAVYWDNDTLLFDGRDLVIDPDDTSLDYKWSMDGEDRALSTSYNLSKPLFNEQPGVHTLTLVVKDAFGGEDEVTFSFTLNATPREEEKTSIMDILTDSLFLTVAIPLLVLIVFGILIAIIIVISKKLRKVDDFVITEDSTLSTPQAEEMARKIRQIYEEKEVYATVSGDEAQISDDEGKFDFDYDLYEVLGIDRGAEVPTIKKAYRKLAAFYHPDKIALQPDIDPEEAAEDMIKVNKAKEFLLNPELKADYDSYISDMDFSFDLGEDSDDDWD
ncbi:MAG: J domain-containing protein, partial [Candidatus Thermoplasmatota archaeon]|nr:J domain-containing protein [Candidatus Thermoplasmatota archaeon]